MFCCCGEGCGGSLVCCVRKHQSPFCRTCDVGLLVFGGFGSGSYAPHMEDAYDLTCFAGVFGFVGCVRVDCDC